MQEFDVVVIGAGPGGYVAAIEAAGLGLSTACVDANKSKSDPNVPSLGGCCLNVGCIPSKALLQTSERFREIADGLEEHGIEVAQPKIDAAKMIARKDEVVAKLTGGIAFLFKQKKVASFFGSASFKGKEGDGCVIEIERDGKAVETIKGRNVIVATGSIPRPLKGAEVDNKFILDNVGALDMTEVPRSLGMIGSGVIGVEMGSVWRRLGAEVTILEAMPNFLAAADGQIAREAQKILCKEQGLNVVLGASVKSVANNGDKGVEVVYEADGKEEAKTFDKLIVCIGRIPTTAGLKPEAIGLKLDERGRIEVNDECATNVERVWAIGDCVRGPMLAHKASLEGRAVAERIAGQKPTVDLSLMPAVIYTDPEVAWVGKTEEQLKKEGREYVKGQYNFAVNGRALCMGKAKGFVKILADAKTDRILGCHMIGPNVSELIGEIVVAMAFSASSEDIARIVHAHPTLSEVTLEAAWSAQAALAAKAKRAKA